MQMLRAWRRLVEPGNWQRKRVKLACVMPTIGTR